ncbi:MAG: ATP synthase F1 subunit gamma [Cyanobacteria bacterium SIG31]|nr:ATP synthase F1 subunit gamma [Cyanobacteria bacterium SIG31]
MPNLKDIKSRIGSVQNTKKITKAMKMVAAAKVKKAENTVKAARPFSDELLHLFRKMLATVTELSVAGLKVDKGIDNYPALLTRREVKTEGLLVITSNKGLAGAYNANIIKTTLKRIKENTEKGIKTVIYPVGQKAISGFKHKNGNFELRDGYTAVANEPTALGANLIAEDIANDFVCGKIDKIDIITTHFNNMMSYNIVDWEILPVEVEKAETHELDPVMEFDPSAHRVLQQVVPMYITNSIYQALLEANASELASRMTAMSAASNNAEEMITTLTIDYNKARQAAITQELVEIVSGASAI